MSGTFFKAGAQFQLSHVLACHVEFSSQLTIGLSNTPGTPWHFRAKLPHMDNVDAGLIVSFSYSLHSPVLLGLPGLGAFIPTSHVLSCRHHTALVLLLHLS